MKPRRSRARPEPTIGVPPSAVRYRSLPGDALLPALLRGEVSVAMTGLAETAPQVDVGTVRTLAVTSARRSPRVDAPTLREAGLDVEFENWRGLLAAPGLDAEDVGRLLALVDELRTTATWREALARNGWTDAALVGADFGAFLDDQRSRVRAALAGS